MAEQEITYIPYGLDEISQQDLMSNLANGVSEYLDSKRWAKKDKYRLAWLAAYQDIMDRGLAGASNDTGIWRINHRKDPIDLDSKSTLDREMYLDAAYYIQLKMSLITPRKKEEEKKKEDLIPFNFKTNFNKYLLKGYGNDWDLFADPEQGWDAQDERGANGLRATTNRRLAMLNALRNYMDSLEDGKYNFEGTTFTDLNDAKTKIQAAIDALNTPDEKDDFPAFNALGLQYRTYFSNGGNDPSGYSIDGNPLTWSLYAKYLNDTKTTEAKAKADAAKKKLALQQANRYNYATRSSIKMIGRNPQELVSKYQNDLGLLQQLNKYAQTPKLTVDEWSDIVGAFNFYNSKGALLNLSKLELERFLGLRAYNGLGPGVLKKIPGVEGFYYDTRTGLVVKPGRTDLQVSQPINGLLELNSPEQQRIDAGNRKVNDGEWLTEDYLRMGAMALDIAGTVAAFLPGYGTAASAGLGLTALGTNMAADIADDSVSGWEVAKNAGINLGLGVVGLVPGLGLASKSGKWIAQAAKWAPRLLTMAAAGLIALDDNIKKSLAKVTSNETLTVNDWKNVGYALSTMAGLARGARGIVDNRKYKPAFKEPTKTEKEYSITTSKGKTIKVEKELADKLSKIKSKDPEKINEEARKILNLSEDEKIDLKNTSWLGSKLKQNGIKIESTTKTVSESVSPRVQAYLRALLIQNSARKSGLGIYSLAPRFLPTSYDIYSGTARLSLPQWDVTDRIKKTWNPIGESKKTSSSKLIQEKLLTSGNLPQPVESSPLFNVRRPIKEPKPNYGKKDLEEVNRSLKEIRDFRQSYGLDLNNIGSVTGGYGKSGSNIKSGNIEVEIGGEKFTFKVSKSEVKDLNEGKISTIRGRIARQVLDISKKHEVTEVAKVLKQLKAKGWLKQGGSIDKPLDTMIENFFKNNKL